MWTLILTVVIMTHQGVSLDVEKIAFANEKLCLEAATAITGAAIIPAVGILAKPGVNALCVKTSY